MPTRRKLSRGLGAAVHVVLTPGPRRPHSGQCRGRPRFAPPTTRSPFQRVADRDGRVPVRVSQALGPSPADPGVCRGGARFKVSRRHPVVQRFRGGATNPQVNFRRFRRHCREPPSQLAAVPRVCTTGPCLDTISGGQDSARLPRRATARRGAFARPAGRRPGPPPRGRARCRRRFAAVALPFATRLRVVSVRISSDHRTWNSPAAEARRSVSRSVNGNRTLASRSATRTTGITRARGSRPCPHSGV